MLLHRDATAREPLAGAVRKGDDRWFDIVRYTYNAMVEAEELGITSKNVKTFASSTDPVVKRLLGIDGDLGPSMGLDKEWAANVIAQVGNYGEMWERAFAASGMPRGAEPARRAGRAALRLSDAVSRRTAARWSRRAVRQATGVRRPGRAACSLMFHVTSANLQSRGIHSGFAFLWEPSRTPVADAPIVVEAGVDSYAKAFVAGALNSLKLTAAAIVRGDPGRPAWSASADCRATRSRARSAPATSK